MSDSSQNFTQRAFRLRLALFYGAVFLTIGCQMAFFPVWLAARGLDAGWIGLIAAAPILARLISVPLVTRLAERRRNLRGALIASTVLTFVAFLALEFVHGPWAILAAFLVLSCFWLPVLPLIEAYALRGLANAESSYGGVRLWGSVAFIGGTMLAGLILPLIGPARLNWLSAGAAALAMFAALLLARFETSGSAAREPVPPVSALLNIPACLAIVATACLIQGSHAAYYTFSAVDWRNAGIAPLTISLLWSIGVIAEIVLFALASRIALSSSALLVAGAGFAMLRWILTGMDLPVPLLFVVQMLHGLSFGATHLGTMGLMARLVPNNLIATAQGLLVASVGTIMALAQLGAGQIYASFGGGVYFAMAGMAACGLVAALIARRGSGEGWLRA